MKIRPATSEDFNALMSIITATSSTDALWNLFMPRAALKDAVFKEHVSKVLKKYLEPSNKDWLVSVVELPEKDITPGAPSIASFAIWDMATATGKAQSATESDKVTLSEAETGSRWLTRFSTCNNGVSEGRDKHFTAFNKRMFLKVIATHPEYEGEGYAKALLRAGYEIARKTEAAVTVFVGPRSYVFFSGLGFHDRGPLSLPPSSGANDVTIKAMSFDPTNERRRSSIMENFKAYITN